MQIMENIHRIRIDFEITDKMKRFVYIYLITGKSCYLIDTGVAGSEKIIEQYLESLGRKIEDIKGIFLTHSHPDHMGSAMAIKKQTNCKVYCSEKERDWIEDIDLQYKERPIPNFYHLAGQSVCVDCIVKDGDTIQLEDKMSLEVFEVSGHAKEDVAYLWNKTCLFSGDAIPLANDFPIFDDFEKSLQTLRKMEECLFKKCCPAWDGVYDKNEMKEVLVCRKDMLLRLKEIVWMVEEQFTDEGEKMKKISEYMGFHGVAQNPLFMKSVQACKKN